MMPAQNSQGRSAVDLPALQPATLQGSEFAAILLLVRGTREESYDDAAVGFKPAWWCARHLMDEMKNAWWPALGLAESHAEFEGLHKTHCCEKAAGAVPRGTT